MTETAERYRAHPFRVLGASSKSTREQLVALRTEAALFGRDEAAEDALTALLHPESRLKAEIRWFPMTEEKEISALMRFAQQDRIEEPVPAFATRSFLALFNQVRLCIALLPINGERAFTASLYTLSLSADTLIPRQVMWEINEDRKISGFPPLISEAEVDAAISELLRETAESLIQRKPESVWGRGARDLSDRLLREYRDEKSPRHNSYLVRITAEALSAMT